MSQIESTAVDLADGSDRLDSATEDDGTFDIDAPRPGQLLISVSAKSSIGVMEPASDVETLKKSETDEVRGASDVTTTNAARLIDSKPTPPLTVPITKVQAAMSDPQPSSDSTVPTKTTSTEQE